MASTFLIVLPVFALIAAGWSVRRLGVMGPAAAGELNRFVVYLALPALLLDIIAHAKPAEIWQPGFIGTFGLSCAVVFAVTLAVRWRGRRHLADATIDALGTSYANTGYMGFPLALAAFGASAMAPTLIAAILTVCAVFAVAIIVIEVALQAERQPWRMIVKVGGSLLRNPLLVAPLLGAVFPITGTQPPEAGSQFLKLLGGAASPCALVSLGLFLAEKREPAEGELGTVGLLIGLKLVLHPMAAWVLGKFVFHLPPALLHPAVLLAALPTGTGPYMLAEFYRREAGVTARLIIGSTVLSVLTITLYLSHSR